MITKSDNSTYIYKLENMFLLQNRKYNINDTYFNKIDTETFNFKAGHNYYKIPFSDILYFCSNGRKINIVTLKKEYEFYGSLDNIYSEVKNKKFLFAHKSFLVNFKYIRKYQYEQLTMSDNKIIPVSQSRRKAVRSMFFEFEGSDLI